ncbi:DUF2514 family protein [Escherichia coli]|uniref:DUF2514 family protein n=1 Tax=Escherichia coli TaxID=562 RepID=UPI00334E6617
MAILIKYWRPLAIIIIVAAGALWARSEIISYGDQRYAEGKAQAIAEQKAADEQEEQRRNAELQKIQADAQQKIDAARNDAVNAAAKSGMLLAETERIRKLAEHYTGTQPASVPTRKVIVMLTKLLDESNDAYRRTAEEADRYYNSGLTCQKQYESLIK